MIGELRRDMRQEPRNLTALREAAANGPETDKRLASSDEPPTPEEIHSRLSIDKPTASTSEPESPPYGFRNTPGNGLSGDPDVSPSPGAASLAKDSCHVSSRVAPP